MVNERRHRIGRMWNCQNTPKLSKHSYIWCHLASYQNLRSPVWPWGRDVILAMAKGQVLIFGLQQNKVVPACSLPYLLLHITAQLDRWQTHWKPCHCNRYDTNIWHLPSQTLRCKYQQCPCLGTTIFGTYIREANMFMFQLSKNWYLPSCWSI